MRPIRRDIQMIFQDPSASLDPRMTSASAISEPLNINATWARSERRERVQELLRVVGLNSYFANRYPHEFSGGQRQRIGIARALALNPKLVICDEPVSALDVSIQAQVLNLLKRLQEQFNLTYLFIAHNLAVVAHISDRIGVMYLGKLVEVGDSREITEAPKHPYTQGVDLGDSGPGSGPQRATGSSWKATCRARPIRRPAAASIPVARSRGRTARSTSRSCWRRAPSTTGSRATTPEIDQTYAVARNVIAIRAIEPNELRCPARSGRQRRHPVSRAFLYTEENQCQSKPDTERAAGDDEAALEGAGMNRRDVLKVAAAATGAAAVTGAISYGRRRGFSADRPPRACATQASRTLKSRSSTTPASTRIRPASTGTSTSTATPKRRPSPAC